jgi:predicted DNA-binding helix-hairpin-helix protein
LKKKLTNGVITNCDEWISNAANDINRKLSIEEIRNIRVSFYIENSVQT